MRMIFDFLWVLDTCSSLQFVKQFVHKAVNDFLYLEKKFTLLIT